MTRPGETLRTASRSSSLPTRGLDDSLVSSINENLYRMVGSERAVGTNASCPWCGTHVLVAFDLRRTCPLCEKDFTVHSPAVVVVGVDVRSAW